MKLFLDTSAMIKLFHREIGTDLVVQLINDQQNKSWISELTIIEFLNTIYRLYRGSRIDNNDLKNVINGFDNECNKFNIVPLNKVVIKEARDLLNEVGRRISLRSLDALQLASYNLVYENNNDWAFVTSDIRLIQIFQIIGRKVIKP